MFEILNESAAQKEKFRTAANRLLNQCFLLKKKEDTRKDYIFVRQNINMFREYFDLLGYDIRLNEDQGVAALVNRFGTGRLSLNKTDSILLLILRLLYLEKRKQLSTFSEEVTVIMEEIREKYSMLRIKSKPNMDKGMEKRMVSLFRKYNIIVNLDSDVNSADTRIIIYPSVLMALPVENINEYYEAAEKRLQTYTGGKDNGETEEDIMPDEAD